MPCYHPLTRAVDKRGNAVFYSKGEFEGSVFEARDTVPCRQCIGCRVRKTLDWAVRCVHELQTQKVGSFITLTYDDDHIPSDAGLVKKHFQDFNKRLRDRVKPLKYRFFGCGEYGDKSNRPHYHAIIFGYDFPDKVHWSTSKGNKYYRSSLLEKAWKMGNCIIGEVNFQTAAYVAKYCQKKITGDAANEHYRRFDSETGESFDVSPEFQIESRRPGLGRDWLDRYMSDVFPSDEVIIEGKRFPVPRYYFDVLKQSDPWLYDEVSEQRADARLFKDAELTIDRLAQIEHCKLLQLEKKILEASTL